MMLPAPIVGSGVGVKLGAEVAVGGEGVSTGAATVAGAAVLAAPAGGAAAVFASPPLDGASVCSAPACGAGRLVCGARLQADSASSNENKTAVEVRFDVNIPSPLVNLVCFPADVFFMEGKYLSACGRVV